MVYIIADIGSNFTTLQEAYISIEKAKKSGADMAKFQCFSEHDLYGDGSTERKIEAWLPMLRDCCDENGIDFGCSSFSVQGLAAVDPCVKIHKVASSCVTHRPLLKAIAATKKPVYMSVGACTMEEISKAVSICKPYVLLYCQATYPSRMFYINAFMFLEDFGIPIGYSDHTTDIWGSALIACRNIERNVSVLEKHFTAFPLMQSSDRPHSLTSDEFKMMVDAIKMPYAMPFGPTPEEAEFVKYHKVRQTDKGYYRVRKP